MRIILERHQLKVERASIRQALVYKNDRVKSNYCCVSFHIVRGGGRLTS